MLYKVKSKKAISPIIAILFIVLIAAVLTSGILSWSKSSTKDKLAITSSESRKIIDDLTCSDLVVYIDSAILKSSTKDLNFILINNSSQKLYNPQLTLLGKTLDGTDFSWSGRFNDYIDKGETKLFSTTSDFNYSSKSIEAESYDENSLEATIVFQTCPNKILIINSYDVVYPSGPFNSHATLDNNLIAYYSFDGSAEDQIGSNDGTIYGATSTSSGLINGAYSFDGTNDYISTGTSSSRQITTGSISLWFYYSSVDSSYRKFYRYSKDSGSKDFFEMGHTNSNSLYIAIRDTTTNILNVTFSLPSTNAWHHIVYTSDSSGNKIYVDGTHITSLNYIDGSTSTQAFLGTASSTSEERIGSGYSDNYWNGKIDELGIW